MRPDAPPEAPAEAVAEAPAEGGAAAPIALPQAPLGQPLRLDNLPADPELRERLLALGLRPGEVITVLRRGQPGGILHIAHGLTEFMLRRQQASELRVTPVP